MPIFKVDGRVADASDGIVRVWTDWSIHDDHMVYFFLDRAGKQVGPTFQQVRIQVVPKSRSSGRKPTFVGTMLWVATGAFVVTDVLFADTFNPKRPGRDDHRVNFAGGDFVDGLVLVSTNRHRFKITQQLRSATVYSTSPLYGYMDARGDIAIPMVYDVAQPVSEALAVVGRDGKYGVLDIRGGEVLPLIYSGISAVSEGKVAVQENGEWRFIDRTGATIIAGPFQEAAAFSEGFAAVKSGDKWGYIDAEGNPSSAFTFDAAEPVRDGMGRVSSEGKSKVIPLKAK